MRECIWRKTPSQRLGPAQLATENVSRLCHTLRMTTSEPLGDGSQEPRPASSQTPAEPTQPAATATLPPQPPVSKKPMGLALAALIVGIVAFLVGLVPVFGALVGITAVVLGILALLKQQPKGMAITGLILGGIAALVSIGVTVGLGAAVNTASNERAPAAISESEAQEPAEAEPVEPEEPVEEAPPPAPAVPAEYESALNKAASYSEMMHMSKAGLYDQLTSEYGEKFSPEAAQYAVDNVQADWNANALAKAKDYQEQMSMSPEAIRDQLTSEYGEQFTAAEADYAIQHLNS